MDWVNLVSDRVNRRVSVSEHVDQIKAALDWVDQKKNTSSDRLDQKI